MGEQIERSSASRKPLETRTKKTRDPFQGSKILVEGTLAVATQVEQNRLASDTDGKYSSHCVGKNYFPSVHCNALGIAKQNLQQASANTVVGMVTAVAESDAKVVTTHRD